MPRKAFAAQRTAENPQGDKRNFCERERVETFVGDHRGPDSDRQSRHTLFFEHAHAFVRRHTCEFPLRPR